MNRPADRFLLKPITLAVAMGMMLPAATGYAQESDEDNVIEEVVATGTRLKGTATAVMEERKNQAFVADIMGAEQISRTGDSDAAGALRRVTGLTLVDGRFIYVRGLGERYSSTQLNGAIVPSPDPTRNVIPLDLFPASIIESLAVQKSYSPSMPAAFGGGNVDIRLKSIPTQRVFNVSAALGIDSETTGDVIAYEGGDRDWFGEDDGNRAVSAEIQERWDSKNFLDDLEPTDALELFKGIKRDYGTFEESADPDMRFNVAFGDSYDYDDDWRFGFLLTSRYSTQTRASEEYELQDPDLVGDSIVNVRFFDDIRGTEKTVTWSTLLTMGVDYNRNHRVDYSIIALNDTRDEVREMFGNTENLSIAEGLRIRDIDVQYEERTLYTNQIKGMHTFPELNFMGVDWTYSLGRSVRNAPGNFNTRFVIQDANEDGIFDLDTEMGLADAQTAARYTFQNLHDRLENFGYNVTYPTMFGKWETEFKVGASFVTKTRTAENRRFDINTLGVEDRSILAGSDFGEIFSDSVLDTISLSSRPLIRDTTIAGDDYVAGQKIDAYYFEADFFYDNKWRFTGGVRWEDFRQVVAPLDPRTNQFDLSDEDDRSQLAFQEDAFYPALAVTYFLEDDMQLRASVGQTVVRPDLREVSAATYLDPLTNFPIAGTPGVLTTDILNYDVRWEWYREAGNNVSVGLFYKDMENPIESVQSPAQDGPPLIRIANAESGEVYGVEVEFLQGLEFIGTGIWDNLFVTGNVTISDSEIVLDRQNIVEQTGVSAAITNEVRRMTGHSEYVLNLQLGFDSDNGEHSASVVYNVFGERILIAGIDGFDDSFEQPFHSLDVVYKYYPDFNSTVTFRVQNVLGEDREISFEDTLLRSETRGTSFRVSFKYDF